MARGNIGDKDFNVQFNDTLLSSKAFINPRYEGCKNTAAVIDNNSFQLTSGNAAERDGLLSSFPKLGAPVEHYTNVIFRFDYIGGADYELKNWSNVSTVRAYEIYDSEEKDLTSIPLNTNIPFYVRTYTPVDYQDYDRRLKTAFKVGNKCKIILSDKGVINSLKDQYTIHFNKGNAPGNSYLIWGVSYPNPTQLISASFVPGISDYISSPTSNTSTASFAVGNGNYINSIRFSSQSGYWSDLGNFITGSTDDVDFTLNLLDGGGTVEVTNPYAFLTHAIDLNSSTYEYYINFNSVKENYFIESSSLSDPSDSLGVGLGVKDTHKILSINNIQGISGGFYRSGSIIIEGRFRHNTYNKVGSSGESSYDGRIYRVTLSNRFLVIDLDKDVELPGNTPNGGWIIPQTLEPTLLSNLSNIIKEIETNLE